MRIIDSCAQCLLKRQTERASKSGNEEKSKEYIEKVKYLLDHRSESDCAPYMVSVFNELYRECFGEQNSFAEIKKEYNDLVLSMEADIEEKIESDILKEGTAKEREALLLERAILYSRVGNYIDFGAMNHVDKNTFLSLFDQAVFSVQDKETLKQFMRECEEAKEFLLITDNCGEIVLDKILVKVLNRVYPKMHVRVLVRGKEVLNDATMEDALYVGMDKVAEVLANGTAVAGTIYERITDEAREALESADVILAKGQGNYESMAGLGRHVYYAFLCKCDYFINKFAVPKLTGMFVAE